MQDHAGLLACRNVDDPNDSAVWLTVDDGQFAKVLVERDEGPPFAVRLTEYFVIAWVDTDTKPSSRRV
jgi:hypothetical protein